MVSFMRLKRPLLLVVLAFVAASCGGQTVQAEDLPPALRQSDQLLGKALATMDRNPATPESSLAMTADVQAAFARSGFADARVRAYAQQKAAEQRTFDARWKPLLQTAHAASTQARKQVARVAAGGEVSPEFLTAYGAFAGAVDGWIAAETEVARDATALAEAFGRAADGYVYAADVSALQQDFADAVARTKKSRDRAMAAVDRMNRAGQALTAVLNDDGGAGQVAAALSDADSSGLFATKWRDV
jgi:hypothetical protein